MDRPEGEGSRAWTLHHFLPGPFTMDNWLGLVVILVVWVALQVWVLPRLGVPT